MIKWTNTKEILPDEGELVLIKEFEDGVTSYNACRRKGSLFKAYGCSWLCIGRWSEIFWVYISDIENNMESCNEYETNKGSAKE